MGRLVAAVRQVAVDEVRVGAAGSRQRGADNDPVVGRVRSLLADTRQRHTRTLEGDRAANHAAPSSPSPKFAGRRRRTACAFEVSPRFPPARIPPVRRHRGQTATKPSTR